MSKVLCFEAPNSIHNVYVLEDKIIGFGIQDNAFKVVLEGGESIMVRRGAYEAFILRKALERRTDENS